MLKKSLFIRILTIASLLLVNLQWGIVSASPVDSEIQSVILYVKPGANGDCLSWDTACELQTALTNATEGDQIWVAEGTYKPTTDSNREATFQLKNGAAIYGGFPAAGGDWSQRDWETNITTLSGEIGIVGNSNDNSYHVVTGSGVGVTTILDGFTINLGNANGTSLNSYGGGGMYNHSSSPTLTNIIFSSNSAVWWGGGMYNDGSSPTLSNVTFSGNTSHAGGGMYNDGSSPTLSNVTFSENTVNGDNGAGGGIYNIGSSPTLTNVTFSSNTGIGNNVNGGGMYNYSSSPTLTDVIFSENTAVLGGGMYNASSSPSLTNVTFSGNLANYGGGGMGNSNSSSPTLTSVTFTSNTATDSGGGMYNYEDCSPALTDVTFSENTAGLGGGMSNYYSSSPTLTNVTFNGNTAINGGGMSNHYSSSPSLTNVTFTSNTATDSGGGMYNGSGSSTLTNAILWGNTPDQIHGSAIVTYSDIQGGYSGTGNINQNPYLGPLAYNGGFTKTHALGAGSPAIDAANTSSCSPFDQRGAARPTDGDGDGTASCDMGSYEYVPNNYFYLPLILKN